MAVYYGEIRVLLSSHPLNQHFDKTWLSHTGVKAILYEAEVQNQAAIALHAEQEIGPETARIKVLALISQKLMLGHPCHDNGQPAVGNALSPFLAQYHVIVRSGSMLNILKPRKSPSFSCSVLKSWQPFKAALPVLQVASLAANSV